MKQFLLSTHMQGSRVLLLILALLAGTHSYAYFQENTAPSTIQVSLADRFNQLEWNAAERGVLLMVDISSNRLVWPEALKLPETKSAMALAEAMQHRLVVNGNVTAIAPKNMAVINTRLDERNLLFDRATLLRYLSASLNEDQWRLFASQRGLGYGDLSPEQQEIFLGLLPPTLETATITVGAKSQLTRSWTTEPLDASAKPTQFRLRMGLKALWTVPVERGPGAFESKDVLPQGSQYKIIAEPPRTIASLMESSQLLYGQRIVEQVPNTRKIGHLAFNALPLAQPIPLAEKETVESLLGRIGKRTGLELYADRRVGPLPVLTRGGTARSGDVLQALCIALTATFRKVGTVYILTDDIQGIGDRYVTASAWAEEASKAQDAFKRQLSESIVRWQPVRLLSFDPQDAMAPERPLLEEIFKEWQKHSMFLAHTVPISSLNPRQRNVLNTALERHVETEQTFSEVSILLKAAVYVIAPNGNRIEDQTLDSGLADWLVDRPKNENASRELTVTLPGLPRSLTLSPHDSDELKIAVTQAKLKGFMQLWVQVPLTPEGKKLLEAAVSQGKEAGLEVVGVVRPFRREPPESTKGRESWDRNVSGKTARETVARSANRARIIQAPVLETPNLSDVVVPEATSTDTSHSLLADIARITGLAGLTLSEPAPSGYYRLENLDILSVQELGYTIEPRQEFIRCYQIDPIDIVPPNDPYLDGKCNLPYFPTMFTQTVTQEREAWNRVRIERNQKALSAIVPLLTSPQASRSLRIETRLPQRFTLLEGKMVGYSSGANTKMFANASSQATLDASEMGAMVLSLRWHPSASLKTTARTRAASDKAIRFARFVEEALRSSGNRWSGINLDMSDMSVKEAVDCLANIQPPQ